MKSFDEFEITVEKKGFEGDYISIERLFDRQIVVHSYDIRDSKFNGQCLYLQLSIGNVKYMNWNASGKLIEMIKKVPESGFPFITTIKKIEGAYLFT